MSASQAAAGKCAVDHHCWEQTADKENSENSPPVLDKVCKPERRGSGLQVSACNCLALTCIEFKVICLFGVIVELDEIHRFALSICLCSVVCAHIS